MNEKDFERIAAIIDEKLDAKFGPINDKLERIEETIDELKEDAEITRAAVNALVEWAENVSVVTAVKFPVKKAE